MSVEGPSQLNANSVNRSFGDLSEEPATNFKHKGIGDVKGLPPWMQAEKISNSERFEIGMYRAITYIPVSITFGVFIFLSTYYIFVSLFDLTKIFSFISFPLSMETFMVLWD